MTARGPVFCDTTPLTTLFYSRDLFGHADPRLEELAQRSYDLVVLAAADFPFVQDGTRRGAEFRALQHRLHLEHLARWRGRWMLAEGSIEARVRAVLDRLADTTGMPRPLKANSVERA